MTNAELTLDQLQAISGGFGAKMNRMVSTNDEAGVTSIECKVPVVSPLQKSAVASIPCYTE